MVKSYRLCKADEFKAVLDHHKNIHRDDTMSIFVMKNNIGHARVGISVSAKLGKAVTRVRIKRQMRAQVSLSDVLPLPYDIVIIARPSYNLKTFQENLETMRSSFSALKLSSKGDTK